MKKEGWTSLPETKGSDEARSPRSTHPSPLASQTGEAPLGGVGDAMGWVVMRGEKEPSTVTSLESCRFIFPLDGSFMRQNAERNRLQMLQSLESNGHSIFYHIISGFY